MDELRFCQEIRRVCRTVKLLLQKQHKTFGKNENIVCRRVRQQFYGINRDVCYFT